MGEVRTATLARPAAVGRTATKRIERPSWRDGRLVLGVALVVVSVLLGARVLAASRATTPVVVAAHPLSAGHVLGSGDLEVRSIHLSGVPGRYWSGRDLGGLVGHRLVAGVGGGDLLARSAVASAAEATPSRVVSIPVAAGRLPDLRAGNRVDVFATYKGATGATGSTVAVVRGVDYVGRDDTGHDVAVRLDVPVEQAGALVRASQLAALDVVLEHAAGDDAGDVGAAPVPDPPGAGAVAR